MKRLKEIFYIRRDERLAVLLLAVFLIILTALQINRYYGMFHVYMDNPWGPFPRNYHVSGFDALVYSMISNWNTFYTVVMRHPLLAFMLLPLSGINWLLLQLTGVNCVQFTWAVVLIACAVYSYIFMYRTLHECVQLEIGDAHLMSWVLFSFAFIMLSAIAPDHFMLTLPLLTFTLWYAGGKIRSGKDSDGMPIGTTWLLFMLTAGVTLTNGVKTFLAALFISPRKFFRWRYLLFGVLLPTVLIYEGSKLEYKLLTVPGEIARNEARIAKEKAQGKKPAQQKKQVRSKKDGTPMAEKGFLQWSDVSTDRVQTVVENLFGETIQLHHQHLLEDVHTSRPVFVKYDHIWQYVVEAILVLFFLAGLWVGRHDRLLWLCLSWFLTDMVVHLGFGFGINEVYIMATHWVFIIPLAIAFLLKKLSLRYRQILRCVIFLLALYLYVYNTWMISQYLLA